MERAATAGGWAMAAVAAAAVALSAAAAATAAAVMEVVTAEPHGHRREHRASSASPVV